MREPMNWALTLFRVAGVPVRVHLVFFLFAVGLVFRQIQTPAGAERALEILLFTLPLLLAVALVHEAGRLVAARVAGGDCGEIVVWPFGGLAPADVPREPRALAISALGGPAALVALLALGSLTLAACGYLPNLNPASDPYRAEVKNYRDGRVYTSAFALKVYKANSATPEPLTPELAGELKPLNLEQAESTLETNQHLTRARLPDALVWVQRAVWLAFVMLLINLLPGQPLDAGYLAQAFVWGRSDFGNGVVVSGYLGYAVAAFGLLVSMAGNEVSPLFVALIVGMLAWVRLTRHEQDETGFGDFSSGYSSLDTVEDAPPKPRRKPMLKRWLTARAAKRIHRENEERRRDDERMESLLEKISVSGKGSLTDEEKRFLERVSARYRNRN